MSALLKYLEAPDAVIEQPSLEDMLQGLDREALAALLVKRAETDLELATWLEAELSAGGSAGASGITIDPEPIRRQAKRLLSGRSSHRRGWSHGEGGVDEEALSALIAKANPLLEAGDGHNALNILEPVMEVLVPAWREQADWDETLHEFFPELGQMIAEAVLMSDLPPEECDDLMVHLDVWQGMLDEYGLDEHLQVAIAALEQGWDEMGLEEVLAGKGCTWPLSGTGDQRGWTDWTTVRLTQERLRVLEISGRGQEYLNLASAAGRHGDHAAMLVRLGRLADAADYARKKFRSTDEVFKFDRFLKENDEIDTALEIAEWGLTLSDGSIRFRFVSVVLSGITKSKEAGGGISIAGLPRFSMMSHPAPVGKACGATCRSAPSTHHADAPHALRRLRAKRPPAESAAAHRSSTAAVVPAPSTGSPGPSTAPKCALKRALKTDRSPPRQGVTRRRDTICRASHAD
ncbi:MAG: hypothetical protein ACXIVF_11850 [Rhizobiaceae bacterium]